VVIHNQRVRTTDAARHIQIALGGVHMRQAELAASVVLTL